MRRVVSFQAPEVEWLAYELPVIAEASLAKMDKSNDPRNAS